MENEFPTGSRTNPVVLVVDDHTDTREMYVQVLDLFGYSTFEAGDGFEAFEKACSLLPDVIVTDIGLPKMDGMELCRRLKANKDTARLPIIALTGFGEAAIAEQARALGIVRVLVKPCTPDLLVSAIQALCSPDGASPQR